MKPTMLLVDDEPMIQLLLQQIFQADYDVHVFSNGQEALEWMYKGVIPDLAIIDIQMPEMDGYQLMEHMKSSGFFKEVPVFVLSGEETSSDRIKSLEMGAIDYLVKPFNPTELLLRANRILKSVS